MPTALDRNRVPVHVAWVAGGSGRWAQRERAGPAELAAASDVALVEVVQGALDLGVRWLTVCAAARDPSADPLATWPHRRGAWAASAGVGIRLLGREGVTRVAGGPGAVPGEADGGQPPLVLTLSAGYSGRAEITHAVERLAADGVDPSAVDEGAIAARLFAPDMPDPDLVVHSGGERRVSDLLLWEVAYSELVFLEEPWPNTRRSHLVGAVVEFQRRDRRYGGLVTAADRR